MKINAEPIVGMLITTNALAALYHATYNALLFVSITTGAILGLHGVWGLWKTKGRIADNGDQRPQ